MAGPRRIKIFDETLRDGEQQATGRQFTIKQKEKFAKRLAGAGVGSIDIMAGIQASEDSLIKNLRTSGVPIVPACMMGERHIRKCIELDAKKVILFYSVSDILLAAKGQTKEQAFELIVKWVEYAHKEGLEIDFAAEDASRTDFDYLVKLGKELKPFIDYFVICDTVGCLQPNLAHLLVRDFIEATGCDVGVHFHNDLGLAIKNTIEGVLAGAELVSATFSGIGERAGNAALEKVLVELKDKYGIVAENFDYAQLDGICLAVAEFFGHGPAAPLSTEAFCTQTGIHVDALLKDPRAYSIFPDIEPIIRFGKYCGESNFRWLFERILHAPLNQETYESMRDKIKDLASAQCRVFGAQDIVEMYKGGELQ